MSGRFDEVGKPSLIVGGLLTVGVALVALGDFLWPKPQ